jgi:hypothetical protein
MLWVTVILGVFVLLPMLQVRKWVLILPILGLAGYVAAVLLVAAAPESLDLARKRLNLPGISAAAPSPGEGNTQSIPFPLAQENVESRPAPPPAPPSTPTREGNILSRLDPARYAELLNSIGANVERFALLWGSGYGGYYTETVMPFPLDMVNAFPNYSIETGRFYLCHEFIVRVLFKFGIVGSIIICALWFVPGWQCFRLYRAPGPGFTGLSVVSLVSFLPAAITTLTWSGKGMILNGFLIAFYMTAAELARRTTRARFD